MVQCNCNFSPDFSVDGIGLNQIVAKLRLKKLAMMESDSLIAIGAIDVLVFALCLVVAVSGRYILING